MKGSLLLGLSSMLCIGLTSSHAMATEFYKWVDAKGVTHYTKTPPPKTAKKVGKIETYGWTNSAPTPSRTDSSQSQPTQENHQPATESPIAPDQQLQEANRALEQSRTERLL